MKKNMKLKKGSNQHIYKYKGLNRGAKISIILVVFASAFILALMQLYHTYDRINFYKWRDANIIAPCTNFCESVTFAVEPVITQQTIDTMVDKYSKLYGKTRYQQNRIKAMVHYLLLREQNYGGSDACGDSGLACGPLQFHQETYIGYRKIMIKRGLITEMGSRLNMKDAIETTCWAISDGREMAWGPIARGEIKL